MYYCISSRLLIMFTVLVISNIILFVLVHFLFFFFFSSRRRHTRFDCDWSSDVCSSDLAATHGTRRQLSEHRHSVPAPAAAERADGRLACDVEPDVAGRLQLLDSGRL